MKKKYQRKSSLVNKTGYTPGYETERNPYNIIPGGDITMQNTPYPVHGTPLNEYGEPMGEGTVMQPGGEYRFGGASYVAEVPMYKEGGSKQDWISHKIGVLMNEGYPQKQAVAIAYSMYEQKHRNGGYQLPKYQLAGTAEVDDYAQLLNRTESSATNNPNKKFDPNAPTPESIALYEAQQKQKQEGVSISGAGEYDTTQNALENPVSGMTNPELMPSSAQLRQNRALNRNNYDENGNAILEDESEDVTADARLGAENSFGGNPMYQFLNLEGGFGTDAALFKTGQAVANKDTLGIVAGAGTSLIKAGKDFLAGMGTQNRYNQVMKSYAENQRENMTGQNRAKGLRFGGYYQDGGEEEYGDLINKYPNRNPKYGKRTETKPTDWYEEGMDKDTYYGFKKQLEAEGYKSINKPDKEDVYSKEFQDFEKGSNEWEKKYGDKSSVRDTWEAKTGMPWSEAKRLGYTDGSAKDNIKLLSELNDSRFNSKNLRKAPMVNSTPQLSKNKTKSPTWYKEGKYKKAYDESDFKDDIDRNKQPYPVDADIIETKKTAGKKPVAKTPTKQYTQQELEAVWGKAPVNPLQDYLNNMRTQPKKPVAKAPAKKPVAKTPQLQKKTPTKQYTQEELNAIWSTDFYNPMDEFFNPDKRAGLQSGVITDKRQGMSHVVENGKVVKSFPVLTGQNVEGNSNPYTVEQLETNKQGRNTPVGTYLMQPNANIYGKRGFNMQPIAAYGEKAPVASNTAIHVTYPGELKQRDPLYKMPANKRYASYGCINGRCEDTEDLADRFPKADTLMVIDSKRGKDRALLSKYGIKEDGGYYGNGGHYQDGGIQPGMEEQMEGQMSNPQEEGMEQQGGGQMEQIMQEVAQAIQQGADPQQIVQQLVQMGIPQEQAIQLVQTVMQQMQGGQQQQPQGTPQLRFGGYYQEGGEAMDEQMEGEDEGADGESERLEQIEDQVEQALKQGADPQQVLQQLVQMGIPQQQAIQMIQEILQEIQGGETEMENEGMNPQMRNGGNYLNALKGKTIKDYTYNPKTNSYTVSYE
jgi:hypothetical protein|nr:MAG TPA: YkuD-like protein [Caudoviricetes sp.]